MLDAENGIFLIGIERKITSRSGAKRVLQSWLSPATRPFVMQRDCLETRINDTLSDIAVTYSHVDPVQS